MKCVDSVNSVIENILVEMGSCWQVASHHSDIPKVQVNIPPLNRPYGHGLLLQKLLHNGHNAYGCNRRDVASLSLNYFNFIALRQMEQVFLL